MTVIAIDGTFASGKGTLGRKLAAHFGLAYLDTGKLYRAVANKVMTAGGDPDSEAECVKAAQSLDMSILNDPTLKSGPVGAAASRVAVHPGVRQALIFFQRDFAAKGAVLDGRDIGTVICPDADVKIFVDAEPNERASRRHTELLGYGEDITFETVLAQLKERDTRDAARKTAPLRLAADSHLLDTTGLSIDSTFAHAVKICEAVLDAN